MTSAAYDSSLRALLPTRPGRWLWSRAKLYLSVILLCVAGFFFVADWIAGGSTSLVKLEEWPFLSMQLAEMIAVLVGFRGVSDYFATRWRARSSDDSKENEPG